MQFILSRSLLVQNQRTKSKICSELTANVSIVEFAKIHTGWVEKIANNEATTRLPFTCSKSTIETIEKGVKICSKLTIITPERRQ